MPVSTENPARPGPTARTGLTDLTAPTTLTRTVAREHVHRTAHAEVFLTGSTTTGPDTFTVTAQWPRCHGFYAYTHGLYDPMLLCETIRQAGMLVAHTGYHVPLGYHLSWSHFTWQADPDTMRLNPHSPADITLTITCADIVRRARPTAPPPPPTSLTMHFAVSRDGIPLAEATAATHWITPALYRRLRGPRANLTDTFHNTPHPTPPHTPDDCGRQHPRDVVLTSTPAPGHYRLRVDTTHPILFDHPVDHTPGMLLLEAARQATHATHSPHPVWPTAMTTRFHHYTELDQPTLIAATYDPAHPHRTHVEARQGTTAVMTAHVTTTALA